MTDPADRDDRCGTYAGASVHKLMREPLCDDCRAAATAYMRKWRADRKAQGRPAADRTNARKRALTILGRRYPDELEEIIRKQLRGGTP